ncbi:MAG: hypothetical protein NT028_10450 [candidate division Zixibacteria bacterium]|nr:hypothetical protein [candidate division Zixibacteria bacterium]
MIDQKNLADVQNSLSVGLTHGGVDFIRTGLDLFHLSRDPECGSHQVIMGNITIGIELLMKGFLARQNLLLVLENPSPETLAALAGGETISLNFNWRRFEMEFLTGRLKLLDFERTTKSFCLFYPEIRGYLERHAKRITVLRNLCVHSVMPFYDKYETEIASFVAITLVRTLKSSRSLVFPFVESSADQEFMKEFQETRLTRVREAFDEAKKRAHRPETVQISQGECDWERFPELCPVCDLPAWLIGVTEFAAYEDEDGITQPGLDFVARSFECQHCGLVLPDPVLLRLGGFLDHFDRSQDVDKWLADHQSYS